MANGWTPERKARQAALIVSWRPWERSTGPRTPEGKAAAARNAWKHGERSAERLLHWQEVRAYLRALRDDLDRVV